MMNIIMFLVYITTFKQIINAFPKKNNMKSIQINRSAINIPYIRQRQINRSSFQNIDIPGVDKKIEYHYIELPNSIPVLMIRDPNSQKSSASLAVKVGASSDPWTLPGLAHFTEHAVFLGSEKYPQENAYKTFLNKNGGSSNAATGMEATTYKFEVNSNAFHEAVDIFSQFFKKPSFTESAIGREVLAVDAEDSKNRILDGRRILQVIKHQILNNHPYSKFSTGNVNTLAGGDAIKNANEVKDAMRSFHTKYYKPQNMALALVGPQPIEQLANLAKDCFSDIVSNEVLDINNNKDSNANEDILSCTNQPIFDENNVHPFKKGGVLIRIRPVKDIRDISILWTLPSTRNQYKNDPTRLLRYLLNHKGEDSIFAKLQDKGWISSTSAGTSIDYIDFNIFEMSATLTPSGFDNYEEVIRTIYSHIDVINNTSDMELRRIWNEIKTISAIDFNFKDKSSAYEIAPFVSKQMLDVPVEHVLSSGYLLEDIDIKQFRDFCMLLTPQRAVMILRSETFSWLPLDSPFEEKDEMINQDSNFVEVGGGPNQKEKWYGVHYHMETLTDSKLRSLNKLQQETSIPSVNPYIAHELADGVEINVSGKLQSSNPTRQHLPDTSDGYELWYSKDEVFGLPKSSVFAFMHTKESADGSPVNSMIGTIFSQVIARKMYQANLAGIGYSAEIGTRGVSLSFVGYSPSIERLVDQICQEFTSEEFWSSVDTTLFSNCKERLVRGLKSWVKERPDSQCDTLLSYLLQENTWLPSQRLEAAELMNLGDVQLRARSSLRGTKLITYFHGDMNSQQASSIHNKISSTVGRYLDPNNHKDNESRGRFLPQQHTVVALPCFNPQDVNNALVMHIQTEVVSPKVSAIMLLIRRFMAEPLFSELRTQRQLGYIVSMSPDGHGRGLGSIRGMNFRVLSNRYSPLYLEQEVEDFLERQSIVFSKLTQQDISDRAATIIKSIIDPPTSYLEEAEQFRNSIINQVPFDWIEQIIKELENMKLEEFINKTNDWMFDKSKRKSVSILLFGNDNLGILKTFLESDCGNKKVVKSIEELNDLRDSLEMHNFDYKP